MDKDLKDLIAFCESRSTLASVGESLKSDLESGRLVDEDAEKRTLRIIKNALQQEDRRQMQAKASTNERKTVPEVKPVQTLSREETDHVMEGLMNKIAGKPEFINDNRLNAKIEKIFSNEAFQRMVERADIFQDISNASLNDSQSFLQSAALSY